MQADHLLSVKLAYPKDTEEMALSFEVGGSKTGFGRETFLKAFQQTGMNETASKKLVSRMCSCQDAWKKLISESFIPDKTKEAFEQMINGRLELL